MAQVTLTNAHVRCPLNEQGAMRSLFADVARGASFGVLGRGRHDEVRFVHALRGVSLDLREGVRLGVIGRNGAGKSTLLKLIAGIYQPDEGARIAEGRMAAVLTLGAGLDSDKSAIQNIVLLAHLFALSNEARDALIEDVASFTELGEYLNLPLRVYSLGMLVRLAFALLTALPGDILLVDEVISTGDAFFLERASARIRALAERAKIMVFASHFEGVLEEFCTHAIWVDRGLIVDVGSVRDVWARYMAQEPRFPEGVAVAAAMLG